MRGTRCIGNSILALLFMGIAAVAPAQRGGGERSGGRAAPANPPTGTAKPTPKPDDTPRFDVWPKAATKEEELAKIEDPKTAIPRKGPGGTDFDGQYRSFIKTDEVAASMGYPSHAESSQQIKDDSATSKENLEKHLGWVLFIKHFTEEYRAPEGTEALKSLYADLVDIEFGGKAAEKKLPFDGDARLTIHRDVVYGKVDAEAQKLDAYLLKSDKPTPVLIEIHGGGWRGGDKSQFDAAYKGDLIGKILDSGISVISVRYRLTPKYQMPAMTEDATRAVQYIRSMAKEWNIDPTRMAAIGGSAGAHLSAWVALHDDLAKADSADPVERESSRLSCFVDESGPMDLTRPNPAELAQGGTRGSSFADAFTAVFGVTNETYRTAPGAIDRQRAASPLFLVTKDDPPAMIVHQGPEVTSKEHAPIPETINDPHSWQQGVLLADAMEDAGIEVVRYIGAQPGKDPAKDVELILGFLKKHLGGS